MAETATVARWPVVRWVGTGVLALVFAVCFAMSGDTASAATCDASNNYCYATRWNAVDGIYRCGYGYCDGAYNYLAYGATVYPGYPGAGCALGNLVCDSNGVPYYGYYGYGYNYGYGVPDKVFTDKGCTVGNYACLYGTGTTPATCNTGNFSCYYANGYYANGYYPYYGYYGYYPYGSTGVYSGNVTIVAPNGNPIKLGSPYRVAEVGAPVPAAAPEVAAPAVTATAPVAAPASVAAPLATTQTVAAPEAPAAAPAQSSGTGTHAQGVAAPAAPAVAPETSGPDARS